MNNQFKLNTLYLSGNSVTANNSSLYLNGAALAGGSSQWVTNGSDIYYDVGYVGIGATATSPTYPLHVDGYIYTTQQIAFQADTYGPIYFGNFESPSNAKAGFSVPGNVILGLDAQSLRFGVGGGGSYFVTSTPNSLFEIRGKDDEVQFTIQANGTQTNNILNVSTYGGTAGDIFKIDFNYKAVFGYDLDIGGTLTKGGGSFLIDHPDPSKTGYKLRHCFVESPTRGDNLYRFEINIDNTLSGNINLPSYWKFLNENPQIWVNHRNGFGRGYGEIEVDNDLLRIKTDQTGVFDVLLIGTRKDELMKDYWDKDGAEVPPN